MPGNNDINSKNSGYNSWNDKEEARSANIAPSKMKEKHIQRREGFFEGDGYQEERYYAARGQYDDFRGYENGFNFPKGQGESCGSRQVIHDDFGETKRNSKLRVFTIFSAILLLAVNIIICLYFFDVLSINNEALNVSTALTDMNDEQVIYLVKPFVDDMLSEMTCVADNGVKSGQFSLGAVEMTYVGDIDSYEQFVIVPGASVEQNTVEEYKIHKGIRYNLTRLEKELYRLFGDSLGESYKWVTEPYYIIDYEGGKLTVYEGSDGMGIDADLFMESLLNDLSASNGSEKVNVSFSVTERKASKASAERIHKMACTQPRDAYQIEDENGEAIYFSEVMGVDFDLEKARVIMSQPSGSWDIPVVVTKPSLGIRDLRKYTFPDVLASYYTYYDSGNVARSHNLALAAQKINGKVLEPGEEFSFNNTVGERNAANGFKKATVYLNEGTGEDYGGGICQTSSTLYFTTILANLKITERRNHLYTVTYMTTVNRQSAYGNDATVNWGETDFRFVNSKEYPVRIDISAKDGLLKCELRGTADGYTANFLFSYRNKIRQKKKYMPSGGKDQIGHDGITSDVTRVVYYNGKEVSREKEHTNTYRTMTTIIYTKNLPAGYEYGIEYDYDFVPGTTTTTAPTSAAPATVPASAEANGNR